MEAVIKKVDASAAWDADGLRVIDDDERAESVVETTDMLLERVVRRRSLPFGIPRGLVPQHGHPL